MSGVPAWLRGCRLKMVLRARLHRGGYLHEDQVVEHPRLTRAKVAKTRQDAPRVTWSVDGRPVADLDEAASRLALAPPLPTPPSPRQLELLA